MNVYIPTTTLQHTSSLGLVFPMTNLSDIFQLHPWSKRHFLDFDTLSFLIESVFSFRRSLLDLILTNIKRNIKTTYYFVVTFIMWLLHFWAVLFTSVTTYFFSKRINSDKALAKYNSWTCFKFDMKLNMNWQVSCFKRQQICAKYNVMNL